MSELEEIQQKAEALKLEFLLIGGLAVIEHGFTRTTSDIDLLIRKRDADSWNRLVLDLGYKLLNDGVASGNMSAPELLPGRLISC